MPLSGDNAPITHNCPQCGSPVSCGSAANLPDCWCAELPHVVPVDDCQTPCLCRSCLEAKIGELSRERVQARAKSDDS